MADDALNYAGLAVTVAHEFGHTVLQEADVLLWDKPVTPLLFGGAIFGRKDADVMRYVLWQTRVVAQAQVTGHDGFFSYGENGADILAISVAFEALQEKLAGLSEEERHQQNQRFFAYWALLNLEKRPVPAGPETEHLPNEFRNSNALRNFPAFAQTYQCAPGDPMTMSDFLRAQFV
jgi:predicted metalloendopeptidase